MISGAEIEWPLVWHNLTHLLIAWVLAMPIAFDRERSSRGAGLRTFPLVAVAACGYTLAGIAVLDTTGAEARVVQGLITGIGFIGGGATLKGGGTVHGTATAASIWNTGLIGMAVAFGRFEIALLISLINFVTLRYVRVFEEDADEHVPDKSRFCATPSRSGRAATPVLTDGGQQAWAETGSRAS